MLTCESGSRFRYTLCADGRPCAQLRWPMAIARARNAAFAMGPAGHVEIDAAGAAHRVEFETFDPPNGGRRSYRFFLMHGETEHARATGQPGRPRSWRIEAAGLDARLVDRSGLTRLRFDMEHGARGGSLRETTRLFALRRRYEVDLPTIEDVAVQAFVFFLAVNATYR